MTSNHQSQNQDLRIQSKVISEGGESDAESLLLTRAWI